MTFLQLHAIAALRGDGLRPELKELLDRLAAHAFANGASGSEGHAEPQLDDVQPIELALPIARPWDRSPRP